ncbi:MAG: hypothetical protein AAFR81_25975 [Chloroflexota bacterium]
MPNRIFMLLLLVFALIGMMFASPTPAHAQTIRECNVKLNPPLPAATGDVEFELLLAGNRIVFRADADVTQPNVESIYSVPIDGSAPAIRLNGPIIPAGGDVRDNFRVFGNTVIYRTDDLVDNQDRLFSVPVTGGTPILLEDEAVRNFNSDIRVSNGFVVYSTNNGVDEILFSVPIDGSSNSAAISETILGTTSSRTFDVQGSTVVYASTAVSAPDYDIFRVPIDGSGPPVAIDTDPGTNRIVIIRIAGNHVLYVEQLGFDRFLYTVPLDGSGPRTLLNTDGSNRVSDDFVITGNRVIYEANGTPSNIYSAPIDGIGATVQLNPTVTAGLGAELPFDGAPVIGNLIAFTADTDGTGGFARDELYAAPIDGSSAATLLSPALGAPSINGSVRATTDSFVYQADVEGNGREIFSVLAPLERLAGGFPCIYQHSKFLGSGRSLVIPNG